MAKKNVSNDRAQKATMLQLLQHVIALEAEVYALHAFVALHVQPREGDQPSQATQDELKHYRKTRHAELLKSLESTDPLLAGLLGERPGRDGAP